MKARNLTKNERELFLQLSKSTMKKRDIDKAGLAAAFYGLEEYGFVQSQFFQGSGIVCGLSEKGKAYLDDNPALKNPFPWDTVMRVVSIVTLAVAFAALFVGCMRLLLR